MEIRTRRYETGSDSDTRYEIVPLAQPVGGGRVVEGMARLETRRGFFPAWGLVLCLLTVPVLYALLVHLAR